MSHCLITFAKKLTNPLFYLRKVFSYLLSENPMFLTIRTPVDIRCGTNMTAGIASYEIHIKILLKFSQDQIVVVNSENAVTLTLSHR